MFPPISGMCKNTQIVNANLEPTTDLEHRFLAIVLPALTLSTHLLLSLSFALPGAEQTWAFWSLIYNGLAAFASVLGLIGALRVSSSLRSPDEQLECSSSICAYFNLKTRPLTRACSCCPSSCQPIPSSTPPRYPL